MLNVETLTSDISTPSVEVQLQVASVKRRRKWIHIHNVQALKNFTNFRSGQPESVNVGQWEHLQGIHLQDVVSDVTLLIGQDATQALIPLEVRLGSDNEPYAVRTALGWTKWTYE